ncbi:MAG: HK97 gp10 family phage protein [Rhizobiales bacterium]|nr:HK97 gp10 family phage protein [Hyphomicrobiales bacterium]
MASLPERITARGVESLLYKGLQTFTPIRIDDHGLYLDVLKLTQQLLQIYSFIQGHRQRADEGAAQEMVDRMRADVPVDTGRLYNGISWRREDGSYVVEATAASHDRGADYAGFVERGTQPGMRARPTVASEEMMTRDEWSATNPASRSVPGRQFRSGRRLRRIHDPHPGTKPQPYFYDNANDVLDERGIDAERNLDEAVRQ